MIKVALVGAPKSGKTRLANKLKKSDGFEVVDNIPQKFSKATDLVVEPGVDYRIDLALLGLRYLEYNKAAHKDKSFVMTTTYLDSLAYSGYAFERMDYERIVSSPDPVESLLDIDTNPHYFCTVIESKIIADSWLFDKTIYLPYAGKNEVYQKVDSYLQSMLERYGLEYETYSPNTTSVKKSQST
jgi:GTPase SAR1 family protein